MSAPSSNGPDRRKASHARVDILLAKSYDPDPRVRRTAQALIGAGHVVRVLAWDRSAAGPTRDRDGPIPIMRVKLRSRPSRGWTQAFFLMLVALRLVPVVWRQRPTVLHAVNLPMLAVALFLAPFARTRPAIVYDAYEIHAIMGADRYPGWLIGVIAVIERYLPRAADLVITPGEDRRRYFARNGVTSTAIPNWVDPPDDLPDRAAARKRLGIDGDRFTVVYTGGLLPSRDLDVLLGHAAAHPEDLVLIAGRGDSEADVARAASDLPNVHLLGWLPNPTDVIVAADALYYALRPENPYAPHAAPNNLYQAIAYAVPLLHRSQGEIRVLAQVHRLGAAFGADRSLSEAIDLVRDPAENAAIRAELRGLQGTYRWSRAAEILVRTYEQLTSARRGVPAAARRTGSAPRLLVLTRIWPSEVRPSVGSYVRARTLGLSNIAVVHPRWDALPRLLLYVILLIDGLRVRGPLRGVEAHMLIPTGFVGLLIARLRRVPLVVYSHGGDVRDWRQLAPLLRFVSRLVATRADAIVTNSDDTAAYLRELGRDPHVVPPGVDLRRFVPTPRPRTKRVLYLGGRTPRKGYGVAKRLADTLVGPSLRDVDPGDVPSLIAEHDVVLMPSVAEPFGLVAVEAIASGRWVVANAVGGLRDIITDGVNGTLVSDGDYASAIAGVPDYDPRQIAGTVERFSLQRWQRELDAVWADLEGRSRRAPAIGSR